MMKSLPQSYFGDSQLPSALLAQLSNLKIYWHVKIQRQDVTMHKINWAVCVQYSRENKTIAENTSFFKKKNSVTLTIAFC